MACWGAGASWLWIAGHGAWLARVCRVQSHWCLAVIYMKTKEIIYYDSMSGAGRVCREKLLRYAVAALCVCAVYVLCGRMFPLCFCCQVPTLLCVCVEICFCV